MQTGAAASNLVELYSMTNKYRSLGASLSGAALFFFLVLAWNHAGTPASGAETGGQNPGWTHGPIGHLFSSPPSYRG